MIDDAKDPAQDSARAIPMRPETCYGYAAIKDGAE
jgi:hypothetical protein